MVFVGAITGTSIDGLDLAILDLPSSCVAIAARTVPIPDSLAGTLRTLSMPTDDELNLAGQASVQLGQFIAESVLDLLSQEGIASDQVAAIGSHGQTIRHQPDYTVPFTCQIGDASVIAETSGIDTIADFRSRDMAAGGQGAPLVPIYHQALFGTDGIPRVIVNIGGISNLTLLTQDNTQARGFDTGPGNALMDAWSLEHQNRSFDDNGQWARIGEINPELLGRLLQDPYYDQPPPKSTGKEHFNLGYVEGYLDDKSLSRLEDVQATLVELTARSISEAISKTAPDAQEWVICGGGRLNGLLMERLAYLSRSKRVVACDVLGIDGDSVEAAAFAYLAWLFTERKSGNVPSVTGAEGARVLGALYPA